MKVTRKLGAIWLGALVISSTAQASEFRRLCEQYLAKAESFVAECKKNARPFNRVFYPGGTGVPVPEHHAAWFDVEGGSSHFGFGCTLGPKREVNYIGMYFFMERDRFLIANSAAFKFIDFNGNVGLQLQTGESFVLLAIQKFTAPGKDRGAWDRNCEIGSFDPAANQTVNKGRVVYTIQRIEGDNPADITNCADREVRILKPNCSTRTFLSFLNRTISPIVYSINSIRITEEGRLYVRDEIWRLSCETDFRPALEYLEFIKETCWLK